MPPSKRRSNPAPECLRHPVAVSYRAGVLRLLDQTRLPAEEAYLDVASAAVLEDCIRRLVVRGAPAIGCAAAFGVVLCARETPFALSPRAWLRAFDARCAHLAATRPTAVNLQWAVERCRKAAHAVLHRASSVPAGALVAALEKEGRAILAEDRRMCARIGAHGAKLLRSLLRGRTTATLMTHCNAGALATGGMGTALAVAYAAQRAGMKLRVFADETRPLLQGARLTAWELSRAGIPVTVICDNMAAGVMRRHKIDAVVVGADRIAANGDAANKTGTYGLAVLARHHGIPFFVAAPSSTFDLSLKDGSGIPIEERARAEIAEQGGRLAVPDGAEVYNPAFDVTPAALITALITEKGVLRPPLA
jgi:methylthioribose-1-phosphate isomerase